MATTDKNNVPQQTDLFKFVIVRPPELITLENQDTHYLLPNKGVLNSDMLTTFSQNKIFHILNEKKNFIYEKYRKLNEDRLVHETISILSESLDNIFIELDSLFEEEKNTIVNNNNSDSSTRTSRLGMFRGNQNDSLRNLNKVLFIDFLFLNLAHTYDEIFSHNRQIENEIEVDLALIRYFNYLSFYRDNKSKITDPKKIDTTIVHELHNALNVFPVFENFDFITTEFGINKNNTVRNVGLADLKVVKQKLIRYQTGEIAHIENVLKGESKERKHRQLDRTENIFTTSTETIEETTKDTQTTDRFELQKEVQKAVQEKMDITAGVTVSGKGIVEYSAHADFAYSTAKQDSEKTASSLAKEIIDKSVSRIQKTVREERTTKTIHEVEELNTHTLNNAGVGSDHIRGIYCWVDKVYLAELFNYGQHLMLEVSIPEPSTFYRQLFDKRKEAPKNLIPPEPLVDFTHNSITTDTYKEFAVKYQAEAIKPPPDEFKTISGNLVHTQTDWKSNAVGNDKILIPEGYQLKSGKVNYSVSYWHGGKLNILIGDELIYLPIVAKDGNDPSIDFYSGYKIVSFIPQIVHPTELSITSGTQVPFSVVSYDVYSYSVSFVGTCQVLDSVNKQWQIDTYEKIVAGYNKLLQIYEASLNAHEVEAGIQIQGQNPKINREIEKTELKRQCIEALLSNSVGSIYAQFDGVIMPNQDPDKFLTPRIDFNNTQVQTRTIQFFEQAIDWTNLTYLFYPYFWGKEERWTTLANTQDIDPIFTKFLQAGSARVSLPVTRNYENAMKHYLATGKVWRNAKLPVIGNKMYLSIADEIRRQTDENYGDPVKEGDWEIVIPTTLVYLKADSDLPNYGK